jgi:hypothetical protein
MDPFPSSYLRKPQNIYYLFPLQKRLTDAHATDQEPMFSSESTLSPSISGLPISTRRLEIEERRVISGYLLPQLLPTVHHRPPV